MLRHSPPAPPPRGERVGGCDAGVDGVPLCQHADHALDTHATVVTLELRRLVTEFRGRQRTQLAECIGRQFRI